ncbi:MAG TPA: cold shock domain-containing protein [Bacteroidales bacterium]|nr:cold shock domain-containing protein [Bacteroidales bacterium]
MGRSNETFNKKEVQAKKDKKRKEKEAKRLERKQQSRDGNNLDDMIAYVDEYGKISSTPPDLSQKKVIKAEDIEIGVPRSMTSGPDESVRKGVVTFFNESKGFGFIKDSASGQDVFVHIKALLEPIKERNKVTFEVVRGPKGPNAVNVKVEK